MHPILFQVHGLVFGSYGILLVTALLAALSWLYHQPTLPGPVKVRYELFLLVMAAGACAATLAEGLAVHLARHGALADLPWPQLIRRGGSIQVAVLGGALALVLWLRWPWRALAQVGDLLAPAAALFQAIARIGCFLAGCCFGRPCGSWMAVTFTDPMARQWAGTVLGVPLHPTQLYYALANGLIFLVLRRLLARQSRPGMVLWLWLVLEGLQRIVVDAWRWDLGSAWLTENRWISLGFITIGVGLALRQGVARRHEVFKTSP